MLARLAELRYNVRCPNIMGSELHDHNQQAQVEDAARSLLEILPRLGRLVASEAFTADGPTTFSQLRALGLLQAGCRRPSELARKMDIAPASASELIDLLVRRGLVERCDDPGDRRCTPLRLTPHGLSRYEAAQRRALTALTELLAKLNPDELVSLQRDLAALLEVLHDTPQRDDRTENTN